jgi:phage shock protein A
MQITIISAGNTAGGIPTRAWRAATPCRSSTAPRTTRPGSPPAVAPAVPWEGRTAPGRARSAAPGRATRATRRWFVPYDFAGPTALIGLRRGLADVATSRKRVELQLLQLQQSSGKLQGQAQQALAAGREDLAREALTRRAAVASQMGDLQGQQASLQAEQDKLTVASQRLQAQVEAFRTRKETLKAAYTAADAETRIREAVTGISEEMGDVGLAVQRAQDKTEQMQARAAALDELLASGALEDATVPGGRDDLQSQLDALTAGHDVDDELARMKAQLPASAPPPAIEGPETASADPPPPPPGRPAAS